MSDDHKAVFVEGVHYAIGKDGHADLSKPLRWEDGAFRAAQEGEPLHNEANHQADLELEVGGE